jgi:hypothetical protein
VLTQASTGETFSEVLDGRLQDGEPGLEHWREKAHNLRFLWRLARLENEVEDPDLDL